MASAPEPGATTRLPDAALDVTLRLDQDVDQGAVVEVALVELGRHAALVQRPALLDLFAQLVEEVIVLDAADDLFFVVQGKITGNGPRQTASGLLGLDQRHSLNSSNGKYHSPAGLLSKAFPAKR